MKSLIKNIAHIQTGIFAKPIGEGDVIYLQVKHFDEFGQLQEKLHGDLRSDEIAAKHLLQPGDVLFAAKGAKNFAAVYEAHNEPAVASTSFFVLRLTSQSLLPEFLAWYLNNHSIQTLLKGQAKGSSMPSISKQVLGNLELSIPNIDKQNTILRIAKLYNKEKSLKRKIETLREKLIQVMLLEAVSQ